MVFAEVAPLAALIVLILDNVVEGSDFFHEREAAVVVGLPLLYVHESRQIELIGGLILPARNHLVVELQHQIPSLVIPLLVLEYGVFRVEVELAELAGQSLMQEVLVGGPVELRQQRVIGLPFQLFSFVAQEGAHVVPQLLYLQVIFSLNPQTDEHLLPHFQVALKLRV